MIYKRIIEKSKFQRQDVVKEQDASVLGILEN